MRDITNGALLHLARFRLQIGAFEILVEPLVERRYIVEGILQELVRQGVDVFDRHYTPIKGSKMGKHEVSWCEPFKRKMQPLIDEWHADQSVPGVIYWLPTDDRGYLPVNKSTHSAPETGDLQKDMANSRIKYFSVDSQLDLDNLGKCKDVNMGTFVVPGGQVVVTLFTPLLVNGRHWGNMSVGSLPMAFGVK
jgi:hypothetical protein